MSPTQIIVAVGGLVTYMLSITFIAGYALGKLNGRR